MQRYYQIFFHMNLNLEKKTKKYRIFFQGIKFKNKEMQNLVFNYSALPSNNIKACSEYDWKKLE